jgi:hypothetical protein
MVTFVEAAAASAEYAGIGRLRLATKPNRDGT